MACRWVRPSGGFSRFSGFGLTSTSNHHEETTVNATMHSDLVMFFLFIKARSISNSIEVMDSPRPQNDRAEVDPLRIFKISPSFFFLDHFPQFPMGEGACLHDRHCSRHVISDAFSRYPPQPGPTNPIVSIAVDKVNFNRALSFSSARQSRATAFPAVRPNTPIVGVPDSAVSGTSNQGCGSSTLPS